VTLNHRGGDAASPAGSDCQAGSDWSGCVGVEVDAGHGPEWRPGTRSSEFERQVIHEIPFLRRTVRRWRREAADADDLVQDTLVRALANAHLWKPGSDLRAWLFTIMRNQFLATVARSSRVAALPNLCPVDLPVEDPHEARLVLRDVGAALGRLPMRQRAAIRLVGFDGKSYEDVAAAMGLSVGAVRCHLARGRDRLRTAVLGNEPRSPCAPCPKPLPPPAAMAFAFGGEPPVAAMAMAD
jgi:RNA polymerase sigma-70 factor (ECF subfamily)